MMPLPGDPATLRTTAAALVAEGERIAGLRRVLAAVDAAPSWGSPAGQAFQARVRAAPPILDRVASRYGAGGIALQSFAAALERAQAETTAAISSHDEHTRLRDRYAELWLAAEQSPDPAEQVRAEGCHARMVSAGEEVFRAERHYRAARRAFEEADRSCASRLRSLAQDDLEDGRLYNTLTGVSDVSARVARELEPLAALPVPQLKPAAAAHGASVATQTVADLALRHLYGDGDVDLVAVAGSITVAGLGRGSSWLRASAKAHRVHGLRARLRAGAAAELDSVFRKTPNPLPPRAPTLKGLTGRARLAVVRRHVEARLRHEAHVRFLDDWRVATANGPQSQRLLIASLAAGGAAKDTQRALEVRQRLQDEKEQKEAQ
jgi:hypothetical protein